jgi:hypothetical protein
MKRVVEAGLCWGAAAVFTAVALPFLAIAALVLRAVLVVAGVTAGLGSAVLYCTNPRFRAWVHRHLGVVESEATPSGAD